MASHAAADDDQTLRADNFVKAVTVRVPSTPRKLRDDDDDGGDSTCCSARSSRAELASNFKRSVAPARFMFYESGSWTNFPGRVVELLRSGFFERKAVLHLEIEGSTYLFDFARMLQIDSGTGSQRSIAWIDDNGKCFFPRRFISDELGCGGSDSPKIEIEIRVDVSGRNSGKRKREDEVGEEENEVSSFKRQSQPQSSSETWPNVKLLREGERAYTAVSNFFLKGIRRIDSAATISAIRQCVRSGPLDKARLEVFQKQIEITKAARGLANVVHAWYGASSRDIQGILTHGFGLPSKVSGSHGVGLYLSHLSLPFSSGLLQPDDNGEKHVLLCRVILGNVEKVEAGSQQCYPSSMEFDTGVDDPRTPTRYVVWSTNMNRHVLPECVVSYKPSDHVPGSLPRKYHVSELISRVRNSLPPSKVQQLSNLVNGLKAGKLARNDFCRQFRLVVGEQLLRSAIPEMRGSEQDNDCQEMNFLNFSY
ncbi:probable inactive poly [ADP-ribose] polymerase SRO3 isoform X2 [Rosa rugosa]|uniref:probable inactive poly [ADP-ribose] polymerase SRO3 isoform X2 n=1 Tax=Rosa rugosa TaxID=74645 RepID=UPI002B40BF70|nr:probable inactive poly [ADP-ribose] polymerase SRO3 isoform X2 [Rosa rugosa]XP_062025616.1 probable inactive poly [ADP-ribose] polymerase SRO3 isoform X2 [Rosa rugosa]